MSATDFFTPPNRVGAALPALPRLESVLSPPPGTMSEADIATVIGVIHEGSDGTRAGRSTVRLRAVVGLIPDVTAFCQLCESDLRGMAASGSAGASSHQTRVIHNRIATWRRVFSHFARLRGIPHDISIRAEEAGQFICELVRPIVPKEWERFFAAGEDVGVPYADLLQVYRRSFRMRGKMRSRIRVPGACGADAEAGRAGASGHQALPQHVARQQVQQAGKHALELANG